MIVLSLLTRSLQKDLKLNSKNNFSQMFEWESNRTDKAMVAYL